MYISETYYKLYSTGLVQYIQQIITHNSINHFSAGRLAVWRRQILKYRNGLCTERFKTFLMAHNMDP